MAEQQDTPKEQLTPAQQIRFTAIGDKAVIEHHPQIRKFMSSRYFREESLVRSIVVEYIKFSAVEAAKASDAEL